MFLNMKLGERARPCQRSVLSQRKEYMPSGRIFQRSDVDRVDEFGSTTDGAVFQRYLAVKAIGGQAKLAIGLLELRLCLVLLTVRKGPGDGRGDDALLGVVLTCARGDAVGYVVVKLGRHGFHRGEGCRRGCSARTTSGDASKGDVAGVHLHFHVHVHVRVRVCSGGLGEPSLRHRVVDLFDLRIKAGRDGVGLYVARRFQKSERVGVDP